MLAGCGDSPADPEGGGPEHAHGRAAVQGDGQDAPRSRGQQVHDDLRSALDQVEHPSDGGGRAWLDLPEGEDGSIAAGYPGSWTILYEAGELGVAEGGAVYLMISPFWNWSPPQAQYEQGAGYTRVTTEAEGVELEPQRLDQTLMAITVRGRALAAGERLRLEYGAGDSGARADSYAERNERFWIAVDGDGDGVRKVLPDSPAIEIRPGPPARLVLTVPSTARPGEAIRITAAVIDPVANGWPEFEGTVELMEPPGGFPAGLEVPRTIELGPDSDACATVEGRVTAAGTYRLQARVDLGDGREVEAISNPLLVTEGGPRILWADLHGHSNVSDGPGTPEDYFRYARDVAALDVVALTDHDHWGVLFMDQHPELWEHNKAVGNRFHEPGRFVTVHGYEYTNWVYGHRHVLYFSDEAPLFSSIDERYDHPDELWEALRGLDALTVPHHPAGGPVPIDWSVAPDPLLDPCVEITSAHGCSEARDCGRMIYSAEDGHFARDALGRGYRLGFIASGDGHDGHPGLTHLGPHYPTGGLTAVLAEEHSRPGVLAALREHRAYATSGARIVLRAALGTARMGETIAAADLGEQTMLFVQVSGTSRLLGVEVVRSGAVVAGLPGDGSADFAAGAALSELEPGEYVYVRVLQEDGETAWSSPIHVD